MPNPLSGRPRRKRSGTLEAVYPVAVRLTDADRGHLGTIKSYLLQTQPRIKLSRSDIIRVACALAARLITERHPTNVTS